MSKYDTIHIQEDVKLSNYSSLGIGGEAAYVCEPQSENELFAVLEFCSQKGLPHKIQNCFFKHLTSINNTRIKSISSHLMQQVPIDENGF